MKDCINELMETFKNVENKGFKKVSDKEVGEERHIEYTNNLKEKAKLVIDYAGGLINRPLPVSFVLTINGKTEKTFSYND